MISFRSKRLKYREILPDDVSERYVEWLNDPLVNQFLETRFSPQNHKSVLDFVQRQMDDPDSYLFRIALGENDQHIGNIKLGPVNRFHQSAQISLFVGERHLHGHGFATEAIDRVTHWGLQELGLQRIEGGCYSDNLGSLRAFLKCGYVVEGFRRNAVVGADGVRQGLFLFSAIAPPTE